MLVLKSKHEKIIKNLQIKIERLERISSKRLKQIFNVEESLKTEMNINQKLRQELAECEKQLKELEDAGVKWLHVDVMDGDFVPSISFGMPVIKSLRAKSNLFFDVHMMVTEPVRYIDAMVDAGADMEHPTVPAIREPNRKPAVIFFNLLISVICLRLRFRPFKDKRSYEES